MLGGGEISSGNAGWRTARAAFAHIWGRETQFVLSGVAESQLDSGAVPHPVFSFDPAQLSDAHRDAMRRGRAVRLHLLLDALDPNASFEAIAATAAAMPAPALQPRAAELPGIDPKDLDVTVVGNQLVLSGEKRESSETKEKGVYHSETRYGSFRRTVPLPDGIDTENVDAQYANGVLTLHLKKTAVPAAKRIEVKVK